jgi:hypothetical protein
MSVQFNVVDFFPLTEVILIRFSKRCRYHTNIPRKLSERDRSIGPDTPLLYLSL